MGGRQALLALVSAALCLAAGCGGGSDDVVGSFGGRSVQNAYVAIVTDSKRFAAYLCDNDQVAAWFMGETISPHINFQSAGGATLTANLSSAGGSGEIILPGGMKYAFDVVPLTGNAGLYRAEVQSTQGAQAVGGWIVLNDQTQRGALSTNTTILSTTSLNLSTSTVTVSGFGTFSATRLSPGSVSFQGGFQTGFNFGG